MTDAAAVASPSRPLAPPPPPAPSGWWKQLTRDRGARAALLALVLIALPVLWYEGRRRWFYYDEWDFLSDRRITSLSDLFRAHNEHWSTIPIIMWRTLWSIFGLHTYRPYQLMTIFGHLAVVVLLWIVMRRAGVGAWMATVGAAMFVLFGPGNENILWAFQIGFVGSMAFGLGQLILADHDGPIDRRDWLGLLSGLAALMCSGVGIPMVVVVGIAQLIRRGWRAALFHTVPLAAAYGIWYLIEQPRTESNPFGFTASQIAPLVLRWVLHSIRTTFLAIGHFQVVALLLAALLIGGLALAWGTAGWRRFRREGASVLALLLGAVVFSAEAGTGRWYIGTAYSETSRYIYLEAAFVIPALVVAANAVVRRWHITAPAMVVLLLIGMPWGFDKFNHQLPAEPYFPNEKSFVLTLANSPLTAEAPPQTLPDPGTLLGLRAGWLAQAKRDGKIPPAPKGGDPIAKAQLPIRLGLAQSKGTPPADHCRAVSTKIDLRPAKGQVFGVLGTGFGASLRATVLDDKNRPIAFPVVFNPSYGERFTVVLPGLHFRLSAAPAGTPLRVCT